MQKAKKKSSAKRARTKAGRRAVVVLDTPEHWQERAETARIAAEQLSDPASRKMMSRIAADYDRLAKHARQRGEDDQG
jgi:DNA-binding ferritin-like protein